MTGNRKHFAVRAQRSEQSVTRMSIAGEGVTAVIDFITSAGGLKR